MGSENRELFEVIRSVAGIYEMEFESVLCTVSNIDLVANTCTCTPINGNAEFHDVILSANKSKGFLLIPKNNTFVICSATSNTTAFISMVSDVDQVYLAGDANGGIIKIAELTAQLNDLVTTLQAQLALIATGIATGGGSYTPATLNAFNKNDYENTKVKNGNG